jgi:hypothetical protein
LIYRGGEFGKAGEGQKRGHGITAFFTTQKDIDLVINTALVYYGRAW